MFDHGKMNHMKRLRNDIILIFGIVLLAGGFWLWQNFGRSTGTPVLRIYQSGNLAGEYDLSVEQTIPVTDDDGGYNLILIQDGAARMSDANCPDQLCMKQRFISANGESIICLPHKLVLQIYAKEEGTVDAVTY